MQNHSLAESLPAHDYRIIMPNGIIGFNDLKHYILTEVVSPFWELKSVEDQTIKFMMVKLDNLNLGEFQYDQRDFSAILSAIDLSITDSQVFVIISIEEQNDSDKIMTVNLRAPFIYHPDSYRGWQLVLADPKYPIAFAL